MNEIRSPQIGSIRDLAHKLRQTRPEKGLSPVVFLIGAGCSVSAGIPTVPQIAKAQVCALARRYGAAIKDPTKALHLLGGQGILEGHMTLAATGDEKAGELGPGL